MSEDAQHRATEFLKGLYAAGRIDEDRFDSGWAVHSKAKDDPQRLPTAELDEHRFPGLEVVQGLGD